MTALIVEDELFAQEHLKRVLEQNFPEISVVGTSTSVKETVEYLTNRPSPDVIFMDVELNDGEAFEVFRLTHVNSQVIMTTAYNSYAIKAFESGSIDYLLKPITLNDLRRAVGRCKERLELEGAQWGSGNTNNVYKKRMIVKVGDTIIPISVENIMYVFSEEKYNYLATSSGDKYLIDTTISQLESDLDPYQFFRCSRGDIVSRAAVKSVVRQPNGQLQLRLLDSNYSPIVSRSRTDNFLEWLES